MKVNGVKFKCYICGNAADYGNVVTIIESDESRVTRVMRWVCSDCLHSEKKEGGDLELPPL